MRTRKHNIDFRRGRQGEGYYLDFTVRGRRVRAFGGKTLREAKLELGRIRAERSADKVSWKEELTFSEFGEEFLELHSKPSKRSWRRDRISIANLGAFFNHGPLTEITAVDIERYRANRRPDVSPATINRELACLKTLFNRAVEWGYLEKSPAAHVHRFKEPPGRERILTLEESYRLIDSACPTLRRLLIVLIGTGMRRGEALALRWADVNLDRGFIHVGNSKSGRSRNVPLSPAVQEALSSGGPSEFVFNGVKDPKTAWHSALKRAELEGVRMHDLRHTAASRMIEAGIDIVTVSKFLGHSSITMTMRYCHPTPEAMQRAADKLGETLPSRQVESTSPLILPC